MNTIGEKFEKLVGIITRLRDPQGGCPWDLQQTHQSLKQYLVEETYEALDAMDEAEKSGNYQKLCEELGDVLLQVVLHAQVARDARHFSIEEVVEFLSQKLIHRHPHVFGSVKAETADEVLRNWERIKQGESNSARGLLADIPRTLPALHQSHRIGEKVARVGFDWSTSGEIREKVREELDEFLEAQQSPSADNSRAREEFGDLLFTLAQLARKMGMNSEEVLREANDKFCRRFAAMEQDAGAELKSLSSERLQELWDGVKKNASSS